MCVMMQEELAAAYGEVKIIAPELVLVERVLFAEQDKKCIPSARQMMAAAIIDESFDW